MNNTRKNEIVYIDFDNTIHPGRCGDDLSIIEPMPHAVEVLQKMHEDGYILVFYSCRTSPEVVGKFNSGKYTAEMQQYLDTHHIPYDRIAPNKPFFHHIIDDRAAGISKINWLKLSEYFKLE